MVQVLPYVPSFLEKLTPYLQQAGEDINTGIQQRSAMKGLESLINPPAQAEPGKEQPKAPVSPLESLSPINEVKTFKLAEKAVGPQAAKVLIDNLMQTQKMKDKENIEIRKEERASERKLQETEQVPFFEKIAKDREVLPSALQSNEQVIDAIIKGDVGPGSLPHLGAIARDLGVPDSLTKLLESTDSKEFNSGIKQLMGRTIKDTFRGTTSAREIEIAEAVQAEIGVKPEANLAAAWAVQSDLMARQEELRLYDELIEQGVSRSKIPAVINKKMMPYRKQLKDEYFEAINQLREKK